MIIREIEKDESLLENFDYFNDYGDTRRWLEYRGKLELIVKLDRGHTEWLEKIKGD